MGKFHGGSQVAFVDILTSLAIMLFDSKERLMHVSLNLTTDFIGSGSLGESVYFKATVKKIGRSVAFTQCDIFGPDLKLISSSAHTKMFAPSQIKLDQFEELKKNFRPLAQSRPKL
mmetsp:Transcript_11249/g.18939  ORF Transcript_11249/g.18939 Transcript_11249/m.18939 type:complete len:116 (+) Transcript_11249:266-613(+)